MNGELIDLKLLPNEFPKVSLGSGGIATFTRKITFASTKVSDGAPIPIELEADFKFFRQDSQSNLEPPQSLPNIKITVTPTAYNKAFTYATVEEFAGTPPAFVNNPASEAAKIALAVAVTAIAKFIPLNHTIQPATGAAAQTKRETDLIALLRDSTAAAFCTHGGPTWLRASHTDVMTFAEISGYVRTNRPLPQLYNLVVLIACSTMPSNGSKAAGEAFGVYEPSSPQFVPDRAFVGFGGEIGANNGPAKDNEVLIPKWVEAFMLALKNGRTVNSAVSIANDSAKIVNVNGVRISPLIQGDKDTKLFGVYKVDRDLNWVKVEVN